MYSFLVLPLLFLVSANCNPAQNGTECTKEQLDERNRCENTIETSSEFGLIKARLQTLIPQCIPNYQNVCSRRNDLTGKCLEQLDAVQNQSLSSDEKRRNLQAINNCLPSFYDEFWTIMEEKLKQRPANGQQQQFPQNGQQQNSNGQQQSGSDSQQQSSPKRQQRNANNQQQQFPQNGQQQNPNAQQQNPNAQQQNPNGQQQNSNGQQPSGPNSQQQSSPRRQQRSAINNSPTTQLSPRTTPTTQKPTPRFARQANFEQKSNGNDQCIPNAQQFSCLIDALIQTNQMAEMGQRLLQQQKQCTQNTSENCQFEANFNKQDCSNQNLKLIVDQLKGQLQECIANQG